MTRWLSSIWQMPDLRSRVLFTLGMLAVFRLGVHVPAPGVDRLALAEWVKSGSNTMFGLYDMFSGGALEQFSVFVLGVTPYITASILVQILTVVVPSLERLSKEGQQGRGQITQYTRYGTIAIALVQAWVMATALQSMKTAAGHDIVINPGLSFQVITAITMTAGSCFVMWLGEQISERGIGNGSSLIITAGIMSRFPNGIRAIYDKVSLGELSLLQCVLLLAVMLVAIGLIVWIERAQVRIPIQYAKRVSGRRVYAGNNHLPLKINTTGVIPPIFASSVLAFPATAAQLFPYVAVQAFAQAMSPGAWLYNYFYIALIVFFSFFYTALMFNPVDVADNLKKSQAYIPGIRPGKQTAEYIDALLNKLTGAGALYLAGVCILPTLLIAQYGIPFAFGGTSLLIVVGVSLDTVAQVEAQLLTRHYDGLQGPSAGGVLKGRRQLLIGAAGQAT